MKIEPRNAKAGCEGEDAAPLIALGSRLSPTCVIPQWSCNLFGGAIL